jgi:hypothetical protein
MDITIVELNDPLSTIEADSGRWAGSRSLGAGFTTIGIWADAKRVGIAPVSDTLDANHAITGRAFFGETVSDRHRVLVYLTLEPCICESQSLTNRQPWMVGSRRQERCHLRDRKSRLTVS